MKNGAKIPLDFRNDLMYYTDMEDMNMIKAVVTVEMPDGVSFPLAGIGESVLGSLKDALKGMLEGGKVTDTKFYHDRYMLPVNQRSIRRALKALNGGE